MVDAANIAVEAASQVEQAANIAAVEATSIGQGSLQQNAAWNQPGKAVVDAANIAVEAASQVEQAAKIGRAHV